MPRSMARLQAANRAFGTRIGKSVLEDFQEYPGMAARGVRQARQVQVEEAQQFDQTQPKASVWVSYLQTHQVVIAADCCLGRP